VCMYVYACMCVHVRVHVRVCQRSSSTHCATFVWFLGGVSSTSLIAVRKLGWID